jgi:dTDP-glucose 4,6-dehydratase
MPDLSSVESLLITGTNGFVGRSIVNQLSKLAPSQLPKRLVMASRAGLNFELPTNLEPLTTLVNQDLTAEWSIDGEISHVINLAADGSKAPYSDQANQIFKDICRNFSKWISQQEQPPRVFHASSGACYGRVPLKIEKEISYKKEDFALNRIEAEQILMESAQEYKYDLNIGRLFTFSGTFLLNKSQYAITDFVRNGVRGNDLYVSGDPRTVRSYLHQDAMAEWILASLVRPNLNSILQIGSNDEVTIQELAEYVAKKTSVNVRYSQTVEPGDIYLPRNLETRTKLGVEEGLSWQIAVDEMIEAVRADTND